eukprot:g2918.t1
MCTNNERGRFGLIHLGEQTELNEDDRIQLEDFFSYKERALRKRTAQYSKRSRKRQIVGPRSRNNVTRVKKVMKKKKQRMRKQQSPTKKCSIVSVEEQKQFGRVKKRNEKKKHRLKQHTNYIVNNKSLGNRKQRKQNNSANNLSKDSSMKDKHAQSFSSLKIDCGFPSHEERFPPLTPLRKEQRLVLSPVNAKVCKKKKRRNISPRKGNKIRSTNQIISLSNEKGTSPTSGENRNGQQQQSSRKSTRDNHQLNLLKPDVPQVENERNGVEEKDKFSIGRRVAVFCEHKWRQGFLFESDNANPSPTAIVKFSKDPDGELLKIYWKDKGKKWRFCTRNFIKNQRKKEKQHRVNILNRNLELAKLQKEKMKRQAKQLLRARAARASRIAEAERLKANAKRTEKLEHAKAAAAAKEANLRAIIIRAADVAIMASVACSKAETQALASAQRVAQRVAKKERDARRCLEKQRRANMNRKMEADRKRREKNRREAAAQKKRKLIQKKKREEKRKATLKAKMDWKEQKEKYMKTLVEERRKERIAAGLEEELKGAEKKKAKNGRDATIAAKERKKQFEICEAAMPKTSSLYEKGSESMLKHEKQQPGITTNDEDVQTKVKKNAPLVKEEVLNIKQTDEIAIVDAIETNYKDVEVKDTKTNYKKEKSVTVEAEKNKKTMSMREVEYKCEIREGKQETAKLKLDKTALKKKNEKPAAIVKQSKSTLNSNLKVLKAKAHESNKIAMLASPPQEKWALKEAGRSADASDLPDNFEVVKFHIINLRKKLHESNQKYELLLSNADEAQQKYLAAKVLVENK